jgi:hypothetical protein
MKNKLFIPILIFSLVLPQVALASWWNPFSWRIFNKIFGPKDTITQEIVLNEEIIPEEVKDKENEESEIEKLKAEIEELKREKDEVVQKPTPSTTQTPTKQNNTPTVSNPAPVPTSQVTNKTLSRNEMYNNILQKYKDFQPVITNERGGLSKNSSFVTERTYFAYLDDILNRINADIGYLESIKHWNPRPENIEIVYEEKLSKLKEEYNVSKNRYTNEIDADQKATIKAELIKYIREYKFELYKPDIHIHTAQLLYRYDNIFGTSYNKDFESKITQQQNIEFANRLLIDLE